MYGIDIYNHKNRQITIGKNKEKKFSLEIYQVSTHDPLEELLMNSGRANSALPSPLLQKPDRKFAHITSSLYNLCSKDVVFEITKERRDAYERIKHELTNALVLTLPDFELPFKLYIDAACSQGLGAALHQRQIVDGEPRKGVICYIS
ncbi:hypothetical protein O181_039475 [Austropuccinia psidii MF-1]|uniref:Reverse transcriptase/retrotransposon-derived protein RNase H-like domain-containing protein n=1 Tax=Austropuccinia psidii MF-1 TaxID=1389203 RepID=A0A9Q3DEZ4_9BASI|nr:hypothetical protein [Austropuccinia psidii MF-1]